MNFSNFSKFRPKNKLLGTKTIFFRSSLPKTMFWVKIKKVDFFCECPSIIHLLRKLLLNKEELSFSVKEMKRLFLVFLLFSTSAEGDYKSHSIRRKHWCSGENACTLHLNELKPAVEVCNLPRRILASARFSSGALVKLLLGFS